jgi:hypothetical protein
LDVAKYDVDVLGPLIKEDIYPDDKLAHQHGIVHIRLLPAGTII